MTPDPDELLRQIMEAGLYGQRQQPLQQRYQLGQQLMETPAARGANVGSTYVASSPLEHAANALRQFMGAKMMREAQHGEQNLTGQLGAGRQAYATALQNMGGKTVAGDYGEPLQGVGANPQGQQQLAMLGALSGDPGMQHASQTALQERHLGVQEQQMQDMMRHRMILEGQGGARLGLQAGRLDQGAQALAQRAVRYDPNASKFVNISPLVQRSVLPGATGASAPAASPSAPADRGAPPAGAAAAPLGKWQDKALKELGADFNPSSGRAGEFGKNQQRVNAAKRVLALAVDENGNARDLTPQQMPELAQSVAALIGGSSAAQAQIEHLLPKSYSKDAAGILQYFKNEPVGAGQQAFVKNMVEAAQREAHVAQQGIDQVRGSLGAKHQRILRSNPEEARKVLQGFGWDLGPDGLPVQAQQPTAAGQPDTAALRKKYGL